MKNEIKMSKDIHKKLTVMNVKQVNLNNINDDAFSKVKQLFMPFSRSN